MKKYFISTLAVVVALCALLLISVEQDTALSRQVLPAAIILICVLLFKNLEIKKEL